MARNVGKGLVLQWNTFWVMKRIPKDVKDQFEGKARFSQNLKTGDFAAAATMAEDYLTKWDCMIKMARLKNKCHVIDLKDAVAVAEKSYEHFGGEIKGTAAASIAVGLDEVLDGNPERKKERLKVVGEATGNLTPLTKHMEAFLNDHGYTPTGADDNRGIIKHWAKEFPYFEAIETEELKSFVTSRLSGSEGRKKLAKATVAKHLSVLKAFWNYCLDHSHISTDNKMDHERLLPRANKTKSQSFKFRNKDANIAYSIDEAWRLQIRAKDYDDKLADFILLGMYTGCRIGELAAMLLIDVHSDRFNIADSKTESGIRSIPIHSDIRQDVERMVQTSTDGYLISGLSNNNKHKNRGKGIGQKFMRHKLSLGFKKKEHSFHSFRSTLASRFQSAGVEEIFAARIIGHKAGGMTYGIYAGDLDWDKAVEAMVKISYNLRKTH